MIDINMKNLYDNSPSFFKELKTNELVGKYYAKFLILLSLLDFPLKNEDENFLREWKDLHYDPNVKVLLQGPKINTKMKFDFIKYYNSVISPKIETIDGYHQTNLMRNSVHLIKGLQVLGKDIEKIVDRIPRLTNGYQIFIDTSKIKRKMVIDNNYIIDFSNIDFGEPNLGISLSNIKKIEFLFNFFSNLEVKLRVFKDVFKYPLSIFKHCFLVFDGINTFDRTIYNSDIDFLKIGGKFIEKGEWFEFIPDFHHVIFRRSDSFKMNDVNRFRIFLLGDNESIPLKTDPKLKILETFNNKVQSKNGFFDLSNGFYYDSFSKTLQSKQINENEFFWKSQTVKFEFEPKNLTTEYLSTLTALKEIEERSELDYEWVSDSEVRIGSETHQTPFWFEGFFFKSPKTVFEPIEFEKDDGKLYRQLFFSMTSLLKYIKEPFELSQRIRVVPSITIRDSVRMNVFGNGTFAVRIENAPSVFFSNGSLFMRSNEKDIYYVYGKEPESSEIFRDDREIELSLNFS